MSELSILIDESGDFGETRDVRDYYLVTFVFHDQNKDISPEISKLEENLRLLKHSIEYIHAGPIIRKELKLPVRPAKGEIASRWKSGLDSSGLQSAG